MNIRLASLRCASLPAALVMLVLAGLAPTPLHRSDNFNNNAFAAYWWPGSYFNMTVAETNQRLEFSRLGLTGSLSGSGVVFNPFGINWKKDFHIQWSYRFNLTNVAAGRKMFMGTALVFAGSFPATMTGVGCGLLRDGSQTYVGWMKFDNGALVDFDGQIITQVTGTIEVDWNKAADRLSIKRSGGPPTNLDGFYAEFGTQYGALPIAINLGAFTANGSINFTGSNVYMDNWAADFYKRAF